MSLHPVTLEASPVMTEGHGHHCAGWVYSHACSAQRLAMCFSWCEPLGLEVLDGRRLHPHLNPWDGTKPRSDAWPENSPHLPPLIYIFRMLCFKINNQNILSFIHQRMAVQCNRKRLHTFQKYCFKKIYYLGLASWYSGESCCLRHGSLIWAMA